MILHDLNGVEFLIKWSQKANQQSTRFYFRPANRSVMGEGAMKQRGFIFCSSASTKRNKDAVSWKNIDIYIYCKTVMQRQGTDKHKNNRVKLNSKRQRYERVHNYRVQKTSFARTLEITFVSIRVHIWICLTRINIDRPGNCFYLDKLWRYFGISSCACKKTLRNDSIWL